jgi:hypothetical protein
MKVQTIADYERSRPNYLEVQYPREVAGWGKFSRKIQELEKQEATLNKEIEKTQKAYEKAVSKSKERPYSEKPDI